MNFKNLTISGIKKLIDELGLEEFYHHYFEWLKKEDRVRAFLSFNDKLDEEIERVKSLIQFKEKLPLWGVPVAVKDNILVKGLRCTAGSKILENYIAPYDATVIKKLKEAGAVIIGKTNLDEFAMGSSTEYSAFQKTLNPYDFERVPGGSSGGSAAAVGYGLVPLALGSDTGGSIRQPAGFCGIFGLKPTYGRVSRYGLIAMASSLDQIGPIANNIDDLITLYEIIEGEDEFDSTSQIRKDVNELKEIRRVGVPKEIFAGGLEKEVEIAFKEFIEKISKFYEIIEINLNSLKYSLPCYYIVMTAEVSSNLARYDGIRYGLSESIGSLLLKYKLSRDKGFGKEVKRRILMGTFVLSHGYYDAYYLNALRMRKKIFQDFQENFKKVDLILMPTSPTLPFKFGERTENPLSMYLADIFTVAINLAYLPALAFPIAFYNNLPIGAQIIGNLFQEKALFSFVKSIDDYLPKITRAI